MTGENDVKLVRYGQKGQERPGVLDSEGRMRDLNAKMQAIEGQGDDLMLELLRDLYSGKYEPIKAIFLKDLYELLEKVIDRYRDAGNVINHIVLKNS